MSFLVNDGGHHDGVRGSKKAKTFNHLFSLCTGGSLLLFLLLFSSVGVVQAADPCLVSVSPSSQTVNASTRFSVSLECVPQQPVKAFELKISFNPTLVRADSVAEGDFFTGYTTFFNPGQIDNTAGRIINIYNLIVGPGNVTSPGGLITINFTAKTYSGSSSLSLYDVRLTNETGYLEIQVTSGAVTITGGGLLLRRIP